MILGDHDAPVVIEAVGNGLRPVPVSHDSLVKQPLLEDCPTSLSKSVIPSSFVGKM